MTFFLNFNAMIKTELLKAVGKYASESASLTMWDEIVQYYSTKGRHYHNLNHLNQLVAELKPLQGNFSSWDTIVFAIAYHDIIYNPIKSDNEERSADFAVNRLQALTVPKQEIELCRRIILATKKHQPSEPEVNLFTDADLSILGAEPTAYAEYTKQIRQEYSIYPDLLYNPERKKVLTHFLAMSQIFKTKEFFERFEKSARENIQNELAELNR